MSLTAATGQIGFAIGGALAGVVFTAFGPGYGANAALAAAGCLALAVVAWRYLPETTEAVDAASDVNEQRAQVGRSSRSLTDTACRQSADAFCGPHRETGHMVSGHETNP